MCINDWRIGRFIRTVITTKILAVGTSFTFNANRQRVGFTVGADLNIVVTAAEIGLLSIDGNQFCEFDESTGPLHFSILTHGDLPTKKFTVRAVGTGVTFGIIEYFLSEEILQAGYDEFRRSLPNMGS
jgi:hypothetical protein